MTKEERREFFADAFAMFNDWQPHDKGMKLYMDIPQANYRHGASVGEGVPVTVEHYAK